ncbi:MAG: hypothetical protein ACOC05_09165, partial [Oceanicaulis sp.]
QGLDRLDQLRAAAALRAERWDDARSRYELLSVAVDAPPGVARRAAEALAYIEQNAPQTEPDAAAAPAATDGDAAPSEAEPAAPAETGQAADPADAATEQTEPMEDGR